MWQELLSAESVRFSCRLSIDPGVLVAIVSEVPSRRWNDKASDFRERCGRRIDKRPERGREAFFCSALASAWLPQSSSWPQSKLASPSPHIAVGLGWLCPGWEGNGVGPRGPPRLWGGRLSGSLVSPISQPKPSQNKWADGETDFLRPELKVDGEPSGLLDKRKLVQVRRRRASREAEREKRGIVSGLPLQSTHFPCFPHGIGF